MASFPGPAQLFVAYTASDKKLGGAWEWGHDLIIFILELQYGSSASQGGAQLFVAYTARNEKLGGAWEGV